MLSFPVAPMKATMGTLPGDADGAWAFEVKWDGHRTLAHLVDGAVRFQSTAGHDVTERWPDVAELGGAIGTTSAILDGEMVVIGDDGLPSFDLVQKRTDMRRHPAVFQIFDVLQIGNVDATDLPYRNRRALLNDLIEPADHWQIPAPGRGSGADLLAATVEQGLEGIMAKRFDSTYRVGTRSKDWLKIKNRRRVELVVGGFTTGTGNRANTFGSLLVGIDAAAAEHDDVGRALTEPLGTADALRFAGGVGTGFDQATLEALTARLRSLEVDTSPFDGDVPANVRRTARWVQPDLRVNVDIAEFTNGGHVRHASFVDTAN